MKRLAQLFQVLIRLIKANDKLLWLRYSNTIILNKTEPLFWGISLIPGYLLLLVYWPITIKFRIPKQTSKPQKYRYRYIVVVCGLVISRLIVLFLPTQ